MLYIASTLEDLTAIQDLVLQGGLSTDRNLITCTLQNSTYWLYKENSQVIGCIGLEQGRGGYLLRSLVVLPEYRKKGLGALLVQAALDFALGVVVYLFSSHAGAYWQRFGFVPASTQELIEAIPDTPQVQGGMARGWITKELAWKKN